jgi:hypothetical protein
LNFVTEITKPAHRRYLLPYKIVEDSKMVIKWHVGLNIIEEDALWR